MNRIIQYAVNQEDGLVVSRVGDQIAWPVLQFDAMQPENNFTPTYALEAIPVFSVGSEYRNLKWTRKIPVSLKNRHRAFWGMRPLREKEAAHDNNHP